MPKKAFGEIVVFLTGGTIAMRSSPLGAVPSDSLEDSLAKVTGASGMEVRFVQWASKPSPHMTPEDMFRLAADISVELDKPSVSGAVVLHGTDLLAETAFVLDKVLTSTKPVVCTGSMRHMEEAGYDGIRNVLHSVLACLSMPPSSEVLIQMADFLYGADDAVKVDSACVSPFTGSARGAVGRIVDETVQFNHPVAVDRPRLAFSVASISARVPLVVCYSGMEEDALRCFCGESASSEISQSCVIDGMVLEAFGAGNIPPAIVPAVESLLKASLPVVLASRCPAGGVLPLYGYEGGGGQLLSKGVISAGTMSAYKAQLLLRMALANGVPHARLASIFS